MLCFFLLFIINIHGLDVNVGGMFGKFAVDTKIGGTVDSEEVIYDYIRILIYWTHWPRIGRWNLNLINTRCCIWGEQIRSGPVL